MTQDIRQIADAVLYEGYMLYPYRPSSVKNRQRWTFGGLYPETYVKRHSGASDFQSQLLIESDSEPDLSVVVRFLHLHGREDGFQEGAPRETAIGTFEFPASGDAPSVSGAVECSLDFVSHHLWRATLCVRNTTESESPLAVLASAHAIVRVSNGDFVSLTDPPERYRELAESCVNRGVWPVLVGNAGSREHMLVSPIILYDYPEVSPESPGNLFDGTEIDEILSLRILTLTDAEKDEIRAASDSFTRSVLERTESLAPEQWMKLHGALRKGKPLGRGDRVVLRPRRQADIMDIALAGKTAEVESVEVDYEGRTHVAVVLDDDPGRDLGELRQPGHRFFFTVDEVEPLPAGAGAREDKS